MIQGFSSGLLGNRELIYETDLPSFQRDFASLKTLDHGYGPSITFTRGSNATYFDVNGVLQTASNNAPRFDHDPATGASRGLLIEEARTNLLVRSAEFDNASWSKVLGSVTSNSVAAPDGTTNADTFTEDTSSGEHIIEQGLNVTTGTIYTWSCFVKANGRPNIALRLTAAATWSTVPGEVAMAFFNLSSGTIVQTTGGAAASISSVGSGWYRVSVTSTALATTFAGFRIHLLGPSNDIPYTGDGTSGIYIWGAQLEAGAFATSYIPTTTAAATRSTDSAVVTPISSFYNQSEGTIFCESATTALVAGDNQGIWGVGDNTLSFQSANTFYATYVSNRIAAHALLSGAPQLSSFNNTSVAQSANTFARSAVVYKQDDYAISTNGSSVATDTSGAVPTMPTGLSIGSLDRAWASGGNHINGWIKKFAYYPKRLSNTLLQNLTA